MLANILDQVIKTYGKEFLGDWDPINNFRIDSLTDPEIHLTNIPFPQQLFELAEIPFAVDYSNIAKVRAKFSWQTFFGTPGAYPFAIEAEDLEIRIRLLYPSEWSSEFWRNKILKAKLKRTVLWEKFASLLGSAQGDRSSVAQTIEPRIVNSLTIRVRNIHLHIVDDNLGATPWAFECHVDEFCIDSPRRGDPRISDIEATGLEQCLLMGLWMRFVGMHIWFREFPKPQLKGKAGVTVNIDKARELRRRLRRNPKDEEAQQLLSELLQRDAISEVDGSSCGGSAGEADATSAASASMAAETGKSSSNLLPELQRLSRQGTASLAGVDPGTLTNMLSKEIQETLNIEDRNVSLSLASRVLRWGWWSGKEASPHGQHIDDLPLTPISAETLLNSNEHAEGHSGCEAIAVSHPVSLSSAKPVLGNPAAAATTAAASAEAAADAAAKAKAVAAETLRSKGEDSESNVSSNTRSESDAELLSGVRAARAFKVVPSQIKDLLDDNTHALRITPKKGIEMHILFKKWELRALGSNLAVNKQSWKTVEMSFLHHDPSLYSPLPGTASPAGQQQSQKGEPLKRQEPPPPLFDGSIEHKPLQLTFTSAAVTSLFNFVKLMDVWFIFLKGAGRPTRLVAREEECAAYVEMWKRRLTAKAEMRDVVDRFISDFEHSSPLYLIVKLRQLAEDNLTWRDGVSAAVLQKQIFGRFTETCCRPERLGSMQWATGETAETSTDGLNGGDAEFTDKERLLFEDIACTVDEASGDERGGFGGKRWFYIDGIVSVLAPNLCICLLPLIQPGMHVAVPTHLQQQKGNKLRPTMSRLGTLGLLERLEAQKSLERDAAAPCSDGLPSTTLMFRICADFKFRQEKRNDFFKCNDIFIDSVFIEKCFASLKATPCDEAILLRARHNPELQTPFPRLLVSVTPLGEMGCTTCVYLPADPPSRIGWGIGPARSPLRGRGAEPPVTAFPTDEAYKKCVTRKSDASKPVLHSARTRGKGHAGSRPVVLIDSITDSEDGKRNDSTPSQQSLSQRIRPSRVYSNIHSFFDRARHLADIVKKIPKAARAKSRSGPKRRCSIGGDKNRTLLISISSKTVWDEELGGPLEKKKTWINIPEISVSAPELIPFAEAIPMNFVTWDLFREIDCLLPATTEDAMGLALGYCTNIDNTLRLTAQKATVVYRLSSLDYSRVLSHLRRDALAEAQELHQQAEAEAAAKAAAQAAAANTGRFGSNPWEGRAAVSDSETPSRSSSSSSSINKGRWGQRSWAERTAAATATGRPLAFIGERPMDARRDFEAQRRLNSRNSSSNQSVTDPYSEALSFSDSFLTPSPSEAGLHAGDCGSSRLKQALPSSHIDASESSNEDSDEGAFFENCALGFARYMGSREALLADMDYEPVEAHGFTSSCCGLKGCVSTFRLTQTTLKRKGSVASLSLNVSVEAAEASVMAQPPSPTGTLCATTDCTVLSVSGVKIGTTKCPRQTVDVSVKHISVGVCKQLVSLAACRRFLMPTAYPYSDVLRDTKPLTAKFAQINSLQRKGLMPKLSKNGSSEQQTQQPKRDITTPEQQAAQDTSADGDTGNTQENGASASPPAADIMDADGAKLVSLSPANKDTPSVRGQGLRIPEEKRLEDFLPVPTSGPWSACDGSRLSWFFNDEETSQKFTSDISPLKFLGPGQENSESYQRWRLARRLRARGREVPSDLLRETVEGANSHSSPEGAAEAAVDVADAGQKSMQVSAKVGCLCVGLYTQQQYLAVLLRVYGARVYLRRKRKDVRVKAKVGEFFVEHSKTRDTQRRSIVLCKKVVHVGAQCRRFCPSPETAVPSSPAPRSEESDPAALIRSEMEQWSGESRRTSREASPQGHMREAMWGPLKLPTPTDPTEDRQRSDLGGFYRGSEKGRPSGEKRSDTNRGFGNPSSPPGTSNISDDGQSLRPLRHSVRQHPKHKAEQEPSTRPASARKRDEEAASGSEVLLHGEQIHAARFPETSTKICRFASYSEREQSSGYTDSSDQADMLLGSQAADFLEETEEEQGAPLVTVSHGIHGRARSGLSLGHVSLGDHAKSQDKSSTPESLRQLRTRAVGAVQRMHQHQHRGLPWHWKAGAADNSQMEEVSNASQGHLTPQSSFDESERGYGRSATAGDETAWLPDVVGDWTLRDEVDADASSRTGEHQTTIGHDCSFGIPGAPLNLLLFEDSGISKRGGAKGREGVQQATLGKGGSTKRIDQMSLSARLQPELKSTEAQLCLQSIHAFPTANLLCCLTDSALCLKSLWNEETIRARCLIACLLGDVRSQKAAQTAGLNLQAYADPEGKKQPKRQFTLNRRLPQQQRADTFSSRGCEDSSDTSFVGPGGGPSRGNRKLRKLARTTFSRRGGPEGFSDGEESIGAGSTAYEGHRKAGRNAAGSRRRKRTNMHPTKDKCRAVEVSPTRSHVESASWSGPTAATGCRDDPIPDSTDSVQQQQQQKEQQQTCSSAADAPANSAAERKACQPHSGVSVSLELVLEDVTCNLLTDDALGTALAEDTESAETHGTVGTGEGLDIEGTAHPTFVGSQEQHGKAPSFRSRRRHGQIAPSSNTSKHSSSSCNRDMSSIDSTASTENMAGGDAGIAFPPYPVLFSPDACVPRGLDLTGDGLRSDTLLRRAVVADAAALGVRLEAVLRVTYTSVATGSSYARKREELKDTLRIGLWRLEATLIRNCTWMLASVVLFDVNIGAECLRLLPPRKKKNATGATRSAGKATVSSRTGVTEVEGARWRPPNLNAVAEGETESDGDTPLALQHALWVAEGRGDQRTGEFPPKRNNKSLLPSPWSTRAATSSLPEGYVSAEGSMPGSRHLRKVRGACDALDERMTSSGPIRRTTRRADSSADAEVLKRRFSTSVPRRLPSSGSSSLFRWVFGSRNAHNTIGAGSSPLGSSPNACAHLRPAPDWRGGAFADLDSYGDRRDIAAEPKNYTDGEMYFPGSQLDGGVHPKQPPGEANAPQTKMSPSRWVGTAGGWTRNLLKTRRSISTLNSGETARPSSGSPPKDRGTKRDYPFGGGMVANTSALQSPVARQLNRRASGRPLFRTNLQPDSSFPNMETMRALSAMPSVGIVGRTHILPKDQQPLGLGSFPDARTREPLDPSVARTAYGKRRGRRLGDAADIFQKDSEEERELFTCTAVDLEIKRVAIWSAVYLQDNKAAANPCRALAAAAAFALERSRRPTEANPKDGRTAQRGSALAVAADTDPRDGDSTAGGSVRNHPLPSHRMRVSRALRKLSPRGTQWHAAEGFRGLCSPPGDTGRRSISNARAGDRRSRSREQSRLSKAAQEVQHLTPLLQEIWAEDWLSVSLPSPPPFAGYFRAQEGRVLLLPVLVRASTKNERDLLQRRREEAHNAVKSEALSRKKVRSPGDHHEGPLNSAGVSARTVHVLHAPTTAAAAAALAGAVFNAVPQEEEKRKNGAAAERLQGANSISPHISLMYRLIDKSSNPHTAQSVNTNNAVPDSRPPDTKIVCRGDIFPTFCACTPFLVHVFIQLFGPDGEMTAVVSRLSMGLQAIRQGMQQQQTTAAEAARAAVQCLPSLANYSEFAGAARTSSLSSKEEPRAVQEQEQQPPKAASDNRSTSALSDKGNSNETEAKDSENTDERALYVDRRLWGPLPGSLLQLGFTLRSALEHLTHDSFASLCIHSLQLTLPSPGQILNLPAVPATSRLLPVTAFRQTLTADATYFLCCLAAAPSSPCVAVDLVLTIKGLHTKAVSSTDQPHQQRWHANNGGALGPANSGPRTGFSPLDSRGSRRYSFSQLQQPYNQNLFSSAVAAAAASASATPLQGLTAAGLESESALGSIKVAAPLLRIELLKRPRIPDEATSSAQEIAHGTSPRISLSTVLSSPAKGRASGSAKDKKRVSTLQQARQCSCVLEVLLKDLEASFVSEQQVFDRFSQHQRLVGGWAGDRRGLGSTTFGSPTDDANMLGSPRCAGETSGSCIEPFRMIISLKDCIIRGEDGSRLFQNASVIPKLFSGDFSSSAQPTGSLQSPHSPYTAAAGPSPSVAGNTTPTGAQGAGATSVTAGRRHQHRTRLSVRQALMLDLPLQDPLLQWLVWVSDEMIYASAEVAQLRVQLRALQAATVYSWGIGLYGALQQLKHFRLQFPALSFGCCFSTASWMIPVGVHAQQLLRVSQLQSRGPSPCVPERQHKQHTEEAEEQAIRRSLLLQRRGLGILSLLYPGLPPPALAPDKWHGYLPLQLPEMAASMSIQQVLQVLEADIAAREAAAAANTTAQSAITPSPWRLQTADLFQHHSDLQASPSQQPGRSHPAYGRSLTASLEPYTGYHGAASAEMPSMRMPFGKSSLLADFRGPLRRGNLPTSQAQRRPSASDAPSSSSPDGVRNSPDDADRESSLASPRRPPESFWSRMRNCICCRRRRMADVAPSRNSTAKVGPGSPKSRVSRLIHSVASSISAASSLSATFGDKRSPVPYAHISPSATGIPNFRSERRRFTAFPLQSNLLEGKSGQWSEAPAPLPNEPSQRKSAPSRQEAAALGAKLQKVVELTFKGIEIWFVLGAGDGDQSSLQAADAAPTPENLKKAGIASLKKGSRAKLKSLTVMSSPKSFQDISVEEGLHQRTEGLPLSRTLMQVLLTAVNRKGLCVEEENLEDRRKQQIVVGLLVACTLRMLQRGPDVNACGEIVELSAMVGSPFPCSEFIVSKKYQGLGRGSSGVWTGHGYQRQLPESQQQQEAPSNSKSMKQSGLASLFHATDTHPLDRQQTILQDEGSIVLSNFPDVLEGYGGALLLPNLQQRSDCLLSVTSSTATVSGVPGGKVKICVTILDPQVHFSFEMFQGLVSLETQARLEQLQVAKSAAAAMTAMKASVAAAAAAAEASAVSLTQQQPIREQDLQPTLPPGAGGTQQVTTSDALGPNADKLGRYANPTGTERTSGVPETPRPLLGVGALSSAPSAPEMGIAALGSHTGPLRVTNYSVSIGDLSMEGSLLRFLRDYAFSVRDAVGPASQQRQRPLFGWVAPEGGRGARGSEAFAEPPIVEAMDLIRLHQQRRGGAFGRALEELRAMSSVSQQQHEEGISVVTSSSGSNSSSSSSVDSPVALTRGSLSWSFKDGVAPRQQQPNEPSSSAQQRKLIQQQASLQPQTQAATYRDSRNTGQRVDDEEAVDSPEMLLLANLMNAGGRSTTKPQAYGRGTQRPDEGFLRDQGPVQPGEEGLRGALTRRKGMGVMENTPAGAPGDVGTSTPVSLLQGVGEEDFKDPYCRVIGFFLSLMNFKLPGETELDIKGEVIKGAFEFHDAHGSLLKVSLLALEGQVYIYPELWSADSVKNSGGRLELMVSGYDPMTNSQEELLHPVSASVEIQRQYVDGQSSHWSLVNIRSAMDGVSVDITSGLLQLVYHIMRTTREILEGAEGSLGRHTSLRVYNDIHSEVLVMHRRRSRGEPKGWTYSRMQPDEWIMTPTSSLYFAVRKQSAAAEVAPEKRRLWRRGGVSHEKLNETYPTLRLESYDDVKRIVEGILRLGTRTVDNAWLKSYEETLLFSSTRRAQAPLEMLVDDMPVLHGGGNLSMRCGWEGLLQLLRKEIGWCCMGRLHADYSNCRAYFLQNAGFKVLVEPVVDRRSGTWSLAVGSCVQLANACSMTLRVYVGRAKRNWGGLAISCFAASVTGETRVSSAHEEYIDILPGCRRSVPLSWFGNGTVPSLAALLHTEGGGEAQERRGEPEIPPVPFPALYKLTNKTGYTQPRRLDIPPFTLRLRGSLMLYGMVDTTDVPTSEASRIAQRYVIKLEPMLSIKNTLPFPITVSVSLRNIGDSRHSHEPQLGAGAPMATAAAGSPGATDAYALSSTGEPGKPLRYAFGNPQAELLAELETRKRQKEEAQQQKSRGTAAKLVADSFVEATIPSHQSWGLPVGEQRLWLVLRVHGAPLEQFNTQLEAFHPTDGRPLGPLELQLLASAASRGASRLSGAAWLLQQENLEGVLSQAAANGVSSGLGVGEEKQKKRKNHRQQQQQQHQQPTTVYESQGFAVLLPSQDTLTVSKVLQLKNGRGESLLPPGALKLVKAEAMNQRRGKRLPPLFSEMQLAADVSRRQITVFAPYFFENLTEATLSVNGALVPSRCRLYTTEEDMRAASIRAYRIDQLADRVLQSSLSRKQDLSGISTARPPLVLKLATLRKQRYLRFGWGYRVASATREEQRQSNELPSGGGGSVDSVTSSLNHGEAERQQTLGGASDVQRDVSRGESPVLKAAASSTDSFIDDDTLGHLPSESRRRFGQKGPVGSFGVPRSHSDIMSTGGDSEDRGFLGVRRARTFKVSVQRRVRKLGRGRSFLHRKNAPDNTFDLRDTDSTEKDAIFPGDATDISAPPTLGGTATATPQDPVRSSNGNAPSTLVLGLCTRYGEAPYSTTKIVSVIPRYVFISRLPFSVVVREVRSRSRVLGGAMGGRQKVSPCELSLFAGETKAFHGVEPRVLLTQAERSLVSCSFSLVPAHVPSFFQVELTPRGGGTQVYLPEHCPIVQVSIVSGLFGDVPALPYTYNGSFIVLSLPENPQFAILNLSSYYLAHAPAERSRRTQQNQLRDDAFAISVTSGSQTKTTAKKGRDESDANLRLIPPWGSVPFIPPYHKNLENARVRLRVLDVEHCPWSVYSLASVDEDLQTIEFVPHQQPQGSAPTGAFLGVSTSPPMQPGSPRSVDAASTRKAPFLQRLPTKTLVSAASAAAAAAAAAVGNNSSALTCNFRAGAAGGGRGVSVEGNLDTEEDQFAQDADTRSLIRPQTPRGGLSSTGANKEKQTATLYVFSLVAANGSRILIITESPEVAEKMRAGGAAFDMIREEFMRKSGKHDGGAVAAAAAAGLYDPTTTSAAAGATASKSAAESSGTATGRPKAAGASSGDAQSPETASVYTKDAIIAQDRSSLLQGKQQQRPPPWLGLSFEFRLPRLTVTWIHQSEVVLALHLTGLSLSGSVNPRQLDVFLEAVPLERVLQQVRMHSLPAGSGEVGKAPQGSPRAARQPAASNSSVGEQGPCFKIPGRDESASLSGSSRSLTAGNAEGNEGEVQPGDLESPPLQRHVEEDYGLLVMTRSAVTLSARIAMLHVDHFVKGDIPVILKNTASKYGKETEEFLEVAVVRSLVDPRQAPTYELLEVRISPFSANIELLVIEQLISIYEKEVEMLHKFALAAPQKPPALQTALKCSVAADALRQLAVMKILEENRQEQVMVAETTAGNASAAVPSLGGAAAEAGGGPPGTGAAAAAAAFLVHPLAMDLTHSSMHSLSLAPLSLDKLRPTTSSAGGYLSSVSGDATSGETHSGDPFNEVLLREPISMQFYATPRVYINPPSSHVLVLPNPRWMELHRASPVYIKNLTISTLSLTVSIRTSEHRISRQVLHIVDALPLDTPYMTIQIARERRKFTVCSWHELIHSLRNSYLRQFIRQSLPSAWISNPCAFVVGFIRGTSALCRQTVKGAKTNRNSFEGLMMGFRIGFILFIIYTMGGVMQSLSHVLNILHKLMRGSRPRPYGVLDAFWKGLNGFILDTFWRPWVAVVTEPAASVTRGDSWWKTTAILIACCVRCLISPLFGLSNFLASVAEGFANTLIGDFEQFTRVQERADLDKKHRHPSPSSAMNAGGGFHRGLQGHKGGDPGGTGLGSRFRRAKRHAAGKHKARGNAEGTRTAAGGVANGSIIAGKQRAGSSFSGAFRRPSSKQVTFAV